MPDDGPDTILLDLFRTNQVRERLIESALEGARDFAGLEPGAKVVITAGRAGIPGGTNLIMIREVPAPG